jgi:hypothetical protein
MRNAGYWAHASLAVVHPRRHVEPHPRVLLRTHLPQHVLVVVDCVFGRNGGIVPAVIEQQFSAACFERREIVAGVHKTELHVGRRNVTVQIVVAPVPVGVLVGCDLECSKDERNRRFDWIQLRPPSSLPGSLPGKMNVPSSFFAAAYTSSRCPPAPVSGTNPNRCPYREARSGRSCICADR